MRAMPRGGGSRRGMERDRLFALPRTLVCGQDGDLMPLLGEHDRHREPDDPAANDHDPGHPATPNELTSTITALTRHGAPQPLPQTRLAELRLPADPLTRQPADATRNKTHRHPGRR